MADNFKISFWKKILISYTRLLEAYTLIKRFYERIFVKKNLSFTIRIEFFKI